jgi:hypothetical protein
MFNQMFNEKIQRGDYFCTIVCTEVYHLSPNTVILPAEQSSILLKTHHAKSNSVYEPEGREFESLRAHHFFTLKTNPFRVFSLGDVCPIFSRIKRNSSDNRV